MSDEEISDGIPLVEGSEVAGEETKPPASLVLEKEPYIPAVSAEMAEVATAPEDAHSAETQSSVVHRVHGEESVCVDLAPVGESCSEHAEDESKEHDCASLDGSEFEEDGSSSEEGDDNEKDEYNTEEITDSTAMPDGDSTDDLHALLAFSKRRLEKAPAPVPVPVASTPSAVFVENTEEENAGCADKNATGEVPDTSSSAKDFDGEAEPAKVPNAEPIDRREVDMEAAISSSETSSPKAGVVTTANAATAATTMESSSPASEPPAKMAMEAVAEEPASEPRKHREENAELYALLNYSKMRLQDPSNVIKKSKTKTKSAKRTNSKTSQVDSEKKSPKAMERKAAEAAAQIQETQIEKQTHEMVVVNDIFEGEEKKEEEEEVKVASVPSPDNANQPVEADLEENGVEEQFEEEQSDESDYEESDCEESSEDESSEEEMEELSLLDDIDDTSPEDVAALAEAARSYGAALLSVAEVADAVNTKKTNEDGGNNKGGSGGTSGALGVSASDLSARLSETSAKLSESLTRGLEAASSMSKRGVLNPNSLGASGSIHGGKVERQQPGEPTTSASEGIAVPAAAGEVSSEEGKSSSSSSSAAIAGSSTSNSMLLNLKRLHESNMRKLQSQEEEKAAKEEKKAAKEASKPVTASLKGWFAPKKKDDPEHYEPVFVDWDGSRTKVEELENSLDIKKDGENGKMTLSLTSSGSRGGAEKKRVKGRRLRKAWTDFRLTCAAIDSGRAESVKPAGVLKRVDSMQKPASPGR